MGARPCVDHLSHVLGALTKEGRPYACKFGNECVFKHVSIEGKSRQRLLDIVGSPSSSETPLTTGHVGACAHRYVGVRVTIVSGRSV